MFSLYVCLFFICFVNCNLFPFDDNHLNASVGGHVVFNCPLDFPFGIEIPYLLEWDKDNEKIFSWYEGVTHAADNYGGRIQLLNSGEWGLGRGSINLTSIRETDNGIYHCIVIFPNRSPPTRNNGTYFFLEVDGGNLIVTPPMNVTCLEGTRAEFECAPKSIDSIVKWYKDGDPISDLMDLAYRAVLESNGSLIIDPTMMTDPGEYECQVLNAAGDKQVASAHLNVEYKAKVVYAPTEKYLPYAKPASLDCHYRANPPLTNLRWEKDGFLFDPYNVQGVFYSRNGSLLFNKVDESHEGYYSCTPYNKLGTEGPSSKIHVIVQKAPQFYIKPLPVYLSKIGGSVEMACVASDGYIDRPPIVTWRRKDGVSLPEDRSSLHGGNLTIVDIIEDDRGIYICSASNEADSVTAESELMIENVAPRAPYNLTAMAGKHSIKVSWVQGYIRQKMDVYVWYRPLDGSEWRTLKIYSPTITDAIIYNLQPGTQYEIRVLSQDHVGDGLFSKPIIVSTLEDNINDVIGPAMQTVISAGPPVNVTAHIIEEGMLITWSPPTYGAENVHKYLVRWYYGTKETSLGSKETYNNYLLIPNLEEDERYTFVVFSVTAQHSQFASDKVVMYIPAYGRIKAILTVTGSITAIFVIAAIVLYATRKKICGLKDRLQDRKYNGRV